MISFINKIWKDPVWSKVIATGIVFLFAQFLIFLWGLFKSMNIIEVYSSILLFFKTEYTVKGWYLFLLYALIFISFSWILIKDKLINSKLNKLDKEVNVSTDIAEPIIKEIRLAPTVFFHNRFCDAFPGTEYGVFWFNNKRDIHHRLQILLQSPTKFDKADGHGLTTDPIWWFRGSSSLFIDRFRILDRKKVLINIDEYNIEKIAAYRGRSYYRDFVYVQCLPDKPTGLYKYDAQIIESYINENNEYIEEFGIYKNKLITRQEYDDGSAIIKGKPVKTNGADLRTRTLTKYNFKITSKFSPYNCDEFYDNSDDFFNKLKNNEIQFEEFVKWMEKLTKNRYDY